MLVFDLREEAQLISTLYAVVPITVVLVLAAVMPLNIRARFPLVLAEDVRPMAFIFVLVLASMVWYEYYERKQADATVQQCLSGGCSVVEGSVSGVVPSYSETSTGRISTTSTRGGYFWVAGKQFHHIPRDFWDYSPANRMHDGDVIRVHSIGDAIVLVEMMEPAAVTLKGH